MTQRIRIALGFAAACGTAVVLSAQTTPQPQTPPRPQTPSARTDTTKPPMTVTGCLKAEKDVPGMSPNVAERAGVGEDYILTNVRTGSGSPSSMGTGTTGGGTTGSGTTGSGTTGSGTMGTGRTGSMASGHTGPMYKVTGIDRDELQKHVNHQVELSGHVDDDDTMSSTGRSGTTSSTPSRTSSDDKDVKEFEATSIRMVSATCPGASQ